MYMYSKSWTLTNVCKVMLIYERHVGLFTPPCLISPKCKRMHSPLKIEAILNSKPLADVSSVGGALRNRDSELPELEAFTDSSQKILVSVHYRISFRTADQADMAFTSCTLHDAIMVMDLLLHRAIWPIGRVATIHSSDDGFVRYANVIIRGSHKHPTSWLVILPWFEPSNESGDPPVPEWGDLSFPTHPCLISFGNRIKQL